MAEELVQLMFAEEAEKTSLKLNPAIIGSLYSFSLNNYLPYFLGWLVAQRIYNSAENIRAFNDIDNIIADVVDAFLKRREQFIQRIIKIGHKSMQAKNVKLFELLIQSLKGDVNPEVPRQSELLRGALKQTNLQNFKETIQEDVEVRHMYEKWQIWDIRKSALQEALVYVKENLGNNILNIQEMNSESLRQLKEFFNEKKINYGVVCYSAQTGEDLTNLAPLEDQGFKAKDVWGFDVATLYDRDRFELISAKQSWLSQSPDRPSATPGGLPNQYNPVLRVILCDKMTNKRFAIFNTHFTPKQEGHEFSWKKLAEIIEEFKREFPGMPLIISGDFNSFNNFPISGELYRFFKEKSLLVDMRDQFTQICMQPLITFITYWGYNFDLFKNDMLGDSLRTQVLDLVFYFGFSPAENGHAAKYFFPIKILNPSTGECKLAVDTEVREHDPEYKQSIVEHSSASDHLFQGAQFRFTM